MKNRLNIQLIVSTLIIVLIGAMNSVNAQEDISDTKIKVKIVTEKNGEKEVIEKTYNSLEEFEADESIPKEHLENLEDFHGIDLATKDGKRNIIFL